jgi:hypothetical protein
VNFLDNGMKRKGISNMISTLFMLAIVVSIGSIILFQGMSGITNFNLGLVPFLGDRPNSNLESIVFEQVHFDPTSSTLTINMRNTGSTDITVSAISMVRTSTQSLIINDKSLSVKMPLGTIATITETINVILGGNGQWSDPVNSKSSYTLTMTTITGNSYKTVVMPFNT